MATAPRSRPDYRLKTAFCEQSSLASFAFAAPASTHFSCNRASKQRSKARNGAQASLSNGPAGGGSSLSRQNDEEGSVLEDIASLFCSCEKLKAMVDSSLNSGVGPDMRNRVGHLFKRVDMLNQSVERAAGMAGGRVPAQLIASFKGLQREHSSLENIVRLATEAGPVLVERDSNNQDEYSVATASQKGTLSMRYGAESVDVELADGQKKETTVEVLSGPKYVMSTPPSEGSSKLAAVRAEIERRVMQQLVKKQFNQPIFGSGQDYTGRESKLTNFQKVPSVNGQRETKGKIEADAVLGAKGLLPQMVEARQLDQSTVLDTSYNKERSALEARQLELENARTVALEIHQQMVTSFEKALLDLREQLSQVTEDLKQKEAMLVAVKEKLMSEQSKLSEKINELSTEITRRLTAEELNHALRKALNELDNSLKDTQNQVVSLGSELVKKERVLVNFQEEQERTKQELRADILSLKDKLCHISEMYEGFKPQSVTVDLGSVKATLNALQKHQTCEQAKMLDLQEKLGTLEKALCSNDKQINELTTEVDNRVTKREVNDVLKNVMDEMEKRRKQLQDRIKLIGSEQEKNETVVGLLQDDWKTHRNQLQTLTTRNDLNVQGVLTELSNMKNKLTDLQEEQKHEQALIREAQQQMIALEGKGLELVKRISEEAEAQKQVLLDEVRTLVEELLEASHVSQGNVVEDALSIQESDATKLDVRHLRNLINDSGRQTLSSELNADISSHDQYEETLHGGAQEMPDKRTASLEAFFSVMGQLIRQELKRMDATSAESLPLAEPHNSGGLSEYAVSGHVHGSGGTYKNRGDQGQNFITLRYESSWNRAFVHYSADNHGWTEVPGTAMQEASNIKGNYWKEFKIKAARLEFVVTDGLGNWDRAPNGSNYVLEKPGIFELSAGVLKAASSN